MANYSDNKDSYGIETNILDLWDIGTTIDVDSSNYVSADFYVNDKSISNYDVRSSLNVSVDKSALAYAAVIALIAADDSTIVGIFDDVLFVPLIVAFSKEIGQAYA